MSALREVERGASPAARHRAARRGPVPPRALALAATCVLAVAVPLAATLDLALPGRALLAVLFTVCVPGVPLALAVGLRDRGLTAALAFAAGPLWAVLAGSTPATRAAALSGAAPSRDGGGVPGEGPGRARSPRRCRRACTP